MESEELEDVLEELYSAGTFDSSGSFSLRADKAREKLAEFSLVDPYAYIVHFYSFGYMAGAQRFRFSIGLRSSVFEFQGAMLPRESLDDVFTYLLTTPRNSVEWAVHELALGLHSGRAAGLRKAVVRLDDRELTVRGETATSIKLEHSTGGVLALELEHSRPLRHYWNHLVRGSGFPELQLLRQAVTQALWREHLAEKTWIERRKDFHDMAEFGVLSSRSDTGYVEIGGPDGLISDGKVQVGLSVRGRWFPVSIKFGKGRVVALEIADTLPLDLSQSSPVLSEQFMAARRRLMEKVADLRTRVLFERPDALSSREKRALVRQVSRSRRTRAKLGEALDVLGLVAHNESRMAAIYAAAGRLQEAYDLLRQELDREGMPLGLRPMRLFDLAILEARLGLPGAMASWKQGFEMLKAQHMDRKSHLVSEAYDSKLSRATDGGESPEQTWKDWQRAMELKRHLGERHPRVAVTLERGSYLRWRAGDFEEALRLATEAGEVRTISLGEGNPTGGQALTLKALAERSLGFLKEARLSAKHRLPVDSLCPVPTKFPSESVTVLVEERSQPSSVLDRVVVRSTPYSSPLGLLTVPS